MQKEINCELEDKVKVGMNEQKRLNTVIEDLKAIFNEKGKKLELINQASREKDKNIERLNKELIQKNE